MSLNENLQGRIAFSEKCLKKSVKSENWDKFESTNFKEAPDPKAEKKKKE